MAWKPVFSTSNFTVGTPGQQCSGIECEVGNGDVTGCLGYPCTAISFAYNASDYSGRTFKYAERWAGQPVPSSALANESVSVQIFGAGFSPQDDYLFVFESVSPAHPDASAWFKATAGTDAVTAGEAAKLGRETGRGAAGRPASSGGRRGGPAGERSR